MNRVLKSRTVQLAIAQAITSLALVIFTELDIVAGILLSKSILDVILRLDTTESIK